MISTKATHVLTIDSKERYVTAIAYRGQAMVDENVEGTEIAPRLATEDEIDTGKDADGFEISVVLARPTVAARLFDAIAEFGSSGRYLGSSHLVEGALGEEWGWNAGMLLSNGELPSVNCTWELRTVERDESGDITNPAK